MRAFHSDTAVKAKYVARVAAHRAADQIVHGTYWERGRGCAVGCSVHSGDHGAYERELGIPSVLARLEDRIFEGMDNAAALDFPLQFLESIPVGADLSLTFYRFMHWLLADGAGGVLRFAQGDGIPAITAVAILMQRKIDGGSVDDAEWETARKVAYAVAHASASAPPVAYAYVASAVASAAAAASASAYADACARSNAYERMAEKLVELLSQAPVDAAAVGA